MTTDNWPKPHEHRPRIEEVPPSNPGAPTEFFVCAECDEPWPCTYEQDLTREEPETWTHPPSPES